MADQSSANLDAQLATEWFNGRGGPIGMERENIPLSAQIVTVADTWAGLTARGTPQLGHHDALAHLEAPAGARLDPAVVDAARFVVAEAPVTAADPAPEPRPHRLGLPVALRRALAGA
jgi:HD-GYP domain-containing protein (c-di-GMP phosphodiesterase class II)